MIDENGREEKAVGRGKGRPSLEEIARIDQHILDVAVEAFVRDGRAATMNAIVAASGLSRKTVYARYANKAELFLAALRYLLGDRTTPAITVEDKGTITATLHNFIIQTLTSVYRPGHLSLRRMIAIGPEYAAQLRPDIMDAVDRSFIVPLAHYLETAVRRNEIAQLDPERAARALVTLILAEAHRRHRTESAMEIGDMEEEARFLCALFCRGILIDATDDGR